MYTAAGRKLALRSTSFMALAPSAALTPWDACLRSKDAPMAIRPRGVATPARLDTVFSMIWGCFSPIRDQAMPDRIPSMMGFLSIPTTVLPSIRRSRTAPSGFVKDRITTAITLYSGTLPIIIRGAIPASPYMFLMKAIPRRAALLR